jgi:hypothetical protein
MRQGSGFMGGRGVGAGGAGGGGGFARIAEQRLAAVGPTR